MKTKSQYLKMTPEQLGMLRPNAFLKWDTSKGCHTFLILMRPPVNSSRLTVDTSIDLNNDASFRHHYVYDIDGTVVGSMLHVRVKFCQFTALSVSRVLIDGQTHDMRCLTGSAGGGLYMFSDGNGSCMALAESAAYPTSPLVVRDKN